MEVICIDDKYSEDQLKVFAKNNIRYPKAEEIVTVIGIEKYPTLGKVGLIVSPYDGQYIKGHSFGIEGSNQLSFNSLRFRKLNEDEISKEEIKEIIKNTIKTI